MDVVRTNVEGVGGSVDLKSRPGHGTTVRILLPLTLAILPALVASAAGQRFAIPQGYLRELVLVQEKERPVRIARVQDAPVCRLRGRLLPLVHLDDQSEEDRFKLQVRTSVPREIEAFVRRLSPQARRIELCHDESRVVVRHGWDPLPDDCRPAPGDRVVALD